MKTCCFIGFRQDFGKVSDGTIRLNRHAKSKEDFVVATSQKSPWSRRCARSRRPVLSQGRDDSPVSLLAGNISVFRSFIDTVQIGPFGCAEVLLRAGIAADRLLHLAFDSHRQTTVPEQDDRTSHSESYREVPVTFSRCS